MSKKTIITSHLLIFLFINTFSQTDTTICVDFNPDLNQKLRKNIINLNTLAGVIRGYQLEIGYERIVKENKTIAANIGGSFFNRYYSNKSFHYNLAYRFYLTNRKYAKTKVDNNKYYIRKQQKTMLSPKGLYVGPMSYLSIRNEYLYQKNIIAGLGVGLGYQFLFFNRIAINTSLQLPLSYIGVFYYDMISYDQKELEAIHYYIRPKLFLNLSIGYAF